MTGLFFVAYDAGMRNIFSLRRRVFYHALLVACFSIVAGVASFFIARGLTAGESNDVTAEARPIGDILAPGPDFSNKVLHYQLRSYYYNAAIGSNGPFIDKSTGEVWAKIGPDNISVAMRSTTRAEDGSFMQAKLVLPAQVTIVFAKPLSGRPPGYPTPPEDPCVKEFGGESADRDLRGGKPPYVDLGKMSAWKRSNLAMATPPSLSPHGLVAPPETIIAPQDAVWLTLEKPTSEGTESMKLEIDPQTSQLLARQSESRKADGTVLASGEEYISAIEVFPAEAVPDSIFALSSLPAGCS